MKTVTYRLLDGTDKTIEYDETAPCWYCDKPVTVYGGGLSTQQFHCPTCMKYVEATTTKNLDVTKITKEAIKEHEGALRTLGDDVETALQQVRIEAVKDYITVGYGKRCETKDLVDFPELADSDGRCVCCEEWEHFDEWLEEQK